MISCPDQLSSTVSYKIKNAGQSQSQIDRTCSAFHLIQNGSRTLFSLPSLVRTPSCRHTFLF
ncbi:hypothetical protein DXD09_08360 [Ligilactobacillus ruminis]|uniref:Uncharacterized protein n=1 Tax=Ligilactobacillus ruminis TaxID=1623 RepID=A0A8B2Z856_9LACO|nr:hypothetical protein DXD09_08360 [Ligilactobacillus ruminis]